MRYVSRSPQPPLDQLVDNLYYIEGTPPYSRLKLPPMPTAVLIINLGDRFLIGDSGARPVEFADGCFLTTGTRHLEFAYPAFTRSVGVHFKPWGRALFVGIPGSDGLRHRFVDVPGLGLVQRASGRIAAASGAVSIGGLCEDAGVSTTHLAHRFKQIVGITPLPAD